MALGEEEPTADPYPPMPFCRSSRPPVLAPANAPASAIASASTSASASTIASASTSASASASTSASTIAPAPASTPALAEDFIFSASYLNSTRQWGKCLHLVVKYRYKPGGYYDYKPMRQEAVELLMSANAQLPIRRAPFPTP